MKKGKEWFIKELLGHKIGDYGNYYNSGYEDGLAYALKLAHQLDEPEVLSQEWIEDNKFLVNDESGVDYTVVESRKLKGLLVPKQKEQKVPKWFDEWCKGRVWGDKFHEGRQFTRSDVRALVQIADGESLHGLTQEQSDEISRDFFKYLDAFHYGYEVEEEHKYNVQLKVRSSSGTVGVFLYKQGDEVLAGDNFRAYYPEEDKFRLTEKEIKDYDERCWLFAEEVRE